MMNEEAYKTRVKRLKEVNNVIKLLDPAIRERAFELLKQYITSGTSGDGASVEQQNTSHVELTDDAEEFFSKFDHAKPADNAKLIAAYHYSQYGADGFSVDEMRRLADDVGLTVPDRLDMTFLDTRKDGKNLFKRAGRGKFKPTVHGEKYLKEAYKVKKGTKQKLERGSE